MLSSVHAHFPPDLWCHLLHQAELTENSLRDWSLDPTVSAHEGLHQKPHDFSHNPSHPPGQLVVAHDSPQKRPSWAPHGQRGRALGPELSHRRCTNVYIVHAASTRVFDTSPHGQR
jgi:hypothetical protein